MTAHTDKALLWLRRPLQVENVRRWIFPQGNAIRDEVVTTNRLIMILKGRLDYTVEDQTLRLSQGTQFFIPAWVRRVWSIPFRDSCEILWCEFDDDGLDSGLKSCWRRCLNPAEHSLEKSTYLRMLRQFSSGTSGLLLEGELKAMLARFWSGAGTVSADNAPRQAKFHPQVKSALRWLERHFHEPDVLEKLYGEIKMSRNYFRIQFARSMQCPPHAYIEGLRMRHARYLLCETGLLVKEVADRVGYQDALYFSKLYKHFWEASPRRTSPSR